MELDHSYRSVLNADFAQGQEWITAKEIEVIHRRCLAERIAGQFPVNPIRGVRHSLRGRGVQKQCGQSGFGLWRSRDGKPHPRFSAMPSSLAMMSRSGRAKCFSRARISRAFSKSNIFLMSSSVLPTGV